MVSNIRPQVGAALSMTYVTGQPIIFVGCGQVRCFQTHDVLTASLTVGTDIYRSPPAKSCERGTGDTERLIS